MRHDNTVKQLRLDGSTPTISTNVPGGITEMEFDQFGDLYTDNRGDIGRYLPDGTFEHVRFGSDVDFGIDSKGNIYTGGADFADEVDRFGIPTVTASPAAASGSLTTPIEGQLLNLEQTTTYYYRAVAATDGGEVFGETESFMTAPVSAAGPVSSASPNGFYKEGDQVIIQVDFTNPVTVTGTPELALNSGGVATYLSGSGGTILSFKYVVQAGENATDLDYTSVNALTLNGGTINVGSGGNATLSPPGNEGSLSVLSDIGDRHRRPPRS